MKRFMAVLLTGCLTFQSLIGPAVPAYGAIATEDIPLEISQDIPDDSDIAEPDEAISLELPEESSEQSQDSMEIEEDTSEDNSPVVEEENTQAADSGSDMRTVNLSSALEVKVISGLPFHYDNNNGVNATVTISGGSISSQSQTLTISGTDASSAVAHFDVPAGTYSVTIQADKFADYIQDNITVKEHGISKIQVCSAKMETGANAHPGWILLGDVTKDGLISDDDTQKMLDVIHSGSNDANADLNDDGIVDITDLQYLVQSLNENQESTIETLALPQQMGALEGTTVSGSLADLLTEAKADSGVSLSTANNAAISAENSVGLEFDLTGSDPIEGMTLYAPVLENEHTVSDITSGEVTVTYESDGQDVTETFFLSSGPVLRAAARMRTTLASSRAANITTDADGSLTLNFGKQIAVKKISIKITGTRKEHPLLEIAKVEFVNQMEERIPAPQLSIPTIISTSSANEEITVSWTAEKNVTGYEVYVEGPVKSASGNFSEIIRVAKTQHRITAINDKPLKNFQDYTIKVRSVNGDWTSPWSATQTCRPAPTNKPAAPDNVVATGGYRSIHVNWKDMSDSSGYMVYYKDKDDKTATFQPVISDFTETADGTGALTRNSYTITGLTDGIHYEIYVKGWNSMGWGPESLHATTSTRTMELPKLPNYKLLNTPNGEGKLTAHIADAVRGTHGNARMVESPLDNGNSAFGVVDNDYVSYWTKSDWDDGVAYPVNNSSKGITVTLDGNYKMDYLTFAAADHTGDVDRASIRYWKDSANPQYVETRLLRRTDENDNPYYIVKFRETIEANQIQMCLGRSYGNVEMKVGEIHFHQYDSLEDDIMALYADDMHTQLKEDVTEQTIQELEDRLETPDKASGEKHPLYTELKLELKTAREILNNAELAKPIQISNQITAQKDSHLGFGGLNAWQPLGRVAAAGDKLLIYVGHNSKRTGESTNLQLVATQYHAESNSVSKVVTTLKIGRNEVTIPQLSTIDNERGGQLYIAYTGNNSADQYAVRVNGGTKIPVLNIYGKSGAERTKAIETYIEELETYVSTIEKTHEEIHLGGKNTDYQYTATNCILNATDIMMESMMYSLPATQVLSGLQSASSKVNKLDNSLQAMEDTMTLFYQHKGLSNSAGTARGNNALPSQHLNIRYMRMFAGAFMYASGNHIGIEWAQTPIASSATNWNGFGWGIAHEIGHNINQGTYAIAEITNNYFAQLLTIAEKGTRFQYNNVYEKVTSGAIGRSSNQATQLALYWQLHLAYDDNTDDRHIFSNYEEQFNNLFFARVDTYSRNPNKAPQSGLTLGSDPDQNLMRLACAAANKNILPFFQRWGMVPDNDTKAYAEKYGAAETKALYYVNDDARDYRASHSEAAKTIDGKDVVKASVSAESNQAIVNISTTAESDVILGYEITRSMTTNGHSTSQVVGFQPINTAGSTTFVDTISSINNRVMTYEVKAVDKFLNYSAPASAGSAKIETGGALSKSSWSVTTDMTSEQDTEILPDVNDPDSGYHTSNPGSVAQKKVNSIDRIIDNDKTSADGIYTGSASQEATITVDMHKTEEITSLKYMGSDLSNISVAVSEDGNTWTTVKEGFNDFTDCADAYSTLWFDSVSDNKEDRDNWIGTYDARYVKLTIPSASDVTIKEIEICGPTGDNLEFLTAGNKPSIGVLKADYKYADGMDEDGNAYIIPKGSLIFTGTYKGNPAYNLVVLYDTNGNVIGAKDGKVNAEQVIFAEVPKHGNLGETSDGTWVYYVEPENWDNTVLQEIDGVRGELYRVDNALTLEGERVVSDTTVISLPDQLPEITLTGTKAN